MPYPRIHLLPFGLALKTSVTNSSNEAAALRFAETLRINSPRFIDHVAAGPEELYLITTWVPGAACDQVWNELTPEDKTALEHQLRAEIHKMQQPTSSNSHVICNVQGNFVDDPRLPWVRRDNPRVFTTCKECFEEVWIKLDDPPRRGGPLRPIVQSLIERADRKIVFCHGDILPNNIVLPGGLEEWRKKRSTACLIDWQTAGWFPLEWEGLKATTLCHGANEWLDFMKEVLPESAAEIDAEAEWQRRSWVLIM